MQPASATKIVVNISIVIGVLAFTLGVTQAFFSDQEHVLGNSISAGRLDLLVNSQNNPTRIVNIQNLEPGSSLEIPKTLEVIDNPARIFLHLSDYIATQGAQTTAEEIEENGTPKSDLENYIHYDLSLGTGTIISLSDTSTLEQVRSCWIPLGTIQPGQPVAVSQSFHFPSSVTNWAQGDTLAFSEEFLALESVDPSTPDTLSGRVWDPAAKKCVPTISPTITPSPTPTSIPPTPTPTPTPTIHPGEPYVDDVVAVTGTFGAPTTLSSDPAVAKPLVVGAPDGNFIQISDSSSVTLAFTDNKAIDGPGADIRIYIIDTLFPAQATIEVSDGINPFVIVPGGPYSDTADVDIDIATTGLSEVKQVRITDLTAVGDTFPQLGFDLDAARALNSVSVP